MRAIDMHVHVPREPGLPPEAATEQLQRHFRVRSMPKDVAEMAAKYKELDVLGLLLSIDRETVSGEPPDSNDYLAGIVKQYPGQFVAFASVDPWKGALAVAELERAVTQLGLLGLKLHPAAQAFEPNDTRFYPLYRKARNLGVPVLFHSGFTGHGAGTLGGGGVKLKYTRPIPYIDDIAADFPDLTIIMAHPAWPWIDEQVAVALHKANVYVDLSGYAPRYLPEAVVREAGTRLQDKVLFGSDYPFVPPDRWLNEFALLAIPDRVRPKILLENARRVLQLRV